MHHPKSGPNLVAEYQVSALPYATSSTVVGTLKIEFPYVTSFFNVRNIGTSDFYVGFTSNGVSNSNRFTLQPSASFSDSIRVKDLFLKSSGATTGSFEIVAGLTMIDRNLFPVLTGSGVSGSSDPTAFGYPGLG